ncbi:Bug family tripartite tricarboxylate transporter substrate binding protein [Delftia sp. PS-11]|uniref:Bug family tripartite tricarboxylate transporter substrate binding protein n=1 Tax=Delftia sp. PS-11 TaxID=2767222 RepID=UPI0024586A50|nr:tripartite tricarboxylate transporter substrate binding protein [Delftia sp. PS-11]KAJ8745934.1 tripartite tricarboxylate transporter substrate binding protein [Delftia sp. PS-11]
MQPRHDAQRAPPCPTGKAGESAAALTRRGMLAALAAWQGLPAAAQQSPPARPLTLVVPYAAGGPLDRTARPLADACTARLGAIHILNVPGDGGAKGSGLVAQATAQDRLLLMGTAATHAVLPWLQPQLGYDPQRDFQPLVLVARMPHVLVMRSDLARQWRIRTPSDLQRFLARPRQPVRYASGGVGSSGHLSGEMYQMLTRLTLQHLPFGGSQPALSALLDGSAELLFDSLPSALPHIRAGRLQAIAVTTLERVPQLPEVPPLNDTVHGFNLTNWFGLFAPAAWPAELAQRHAAVFSQAMRHPPLQEMLAAMGVLPDNLQLQEFSRFLRSEHSKYGLLVQAARIRQL